MRLRKKLNDVLANGELSLLFWASEPVTIPNSNIDAKAAPKTLTERLIQFSLFAPISLIERAPD